MTSQIVRAVVNQRVEWRLYINTYLHSTHNTYESAVRYESKIKNLFTIAGEQAPKGGDNWTEENQPKSSH